MKKSTLVSAILIVVLSLLMGASVSLAQDQPDTRAQAIKDNVNPKDLPEAVRQALKDTVPTDNPVSAEKVSRDGQVGYKIVTEGPQGKHIILVTENGKVLKSDIMQPEAAPAAPETRPAAAKEAVNLKDLPEPVRQALKDTAPTDTPVSAEKVSRDGRVGYAVVMDGAQGKHVIVVSEDGKVLKGDAKPQDPPDTRAAAAKNAVNVKDLPDPVRQALKDTAPTDEPVSAEKINRRGQVGYKIVTDGPQGKHVIVVSENGKVLKSDVNKSQPPQSRRQAAKEEISLRDLPPQVIQAVKDRAPNDNPVSAEKINRGGRVGYVIVLDGAQGRHRVLVSEDGKIVKDTPESGAPTDVQMKNQNVKDQANPQQIDKGKDQEVERIKQQQETKNRRDQHRQ